MANKVYLAFYKNKRSWFKEPIKALADAITRFFTKGKYSHCEIAVEKQKPILTQSENNIALAVLKTRTAFDCYSSSVRDKGVRCKEIDVSDTSKWDLIPLDGVIEEQIKAYFNRTSWKKYDWWGALGIVLGIKQKRSKYFCSEWCFNAIQNSEDGWRFSPNQLSVMFKNIK